MLIVLDSDVMMMYEIPGEFESYVVKEMFVSFVSVRFEMHTLARKLNGK